MKLIWDENGDRRFICFVKYEGKTLLVYDQKNKYGWDNHHAIDWNAHDEFHGARMIIDKTFRLEQ